MVIMKVRYIFILLFLFLIVDSKAQVYQSSFRTDVVPLLTGAGLTGLSIILRNNANPATIEEINLLDKNNLNFLDRRAVNNFSSTAGFASDIVLYSSISFPFITYISKNCRSEGGVIAIMILETALINNGIVSVIKSSSNRYRPFNYNSDVPLIEKLSGESRRSFVSGHVGNSAALTYLTARVITDLHPDMNNKFLIWGTAAAIPALMGYLRVEAGRHFPTDVIGGYIIGAAVGYIIPSLHLKRNSNLSINTNGMSSLSISLKF
jgi:membrane-associated phospholipid phosphatase